MSLDVVFPNAQTCVWMEAGVISFWLCKRAFDCEHCPLDAALRGGSLMSDPQLHQSAANGVQRSAK